MNLWQKKVSSKYYGTVKDQTVVLECSAVLIKYCAGRKMTAA